MTRRPSRVPVAASAPTPPSRRDVLKARAAAAFHRGVDALERPQVFRVAIVLLTVVAFLVRGPVSVMSKEIDGEGLGDARVYFWHAKNFANGVYPSQYHRSDGWSIFMSLALRAWGHGPFIIYGDPGVEDVWNKAVTNLFTAAVGAALVPASVLLGRQLMSRRASLAAGTFVAFDPLLLFDSTRAMSEPAFALTLTLAAAAILLARKNPLWLIPAGFLAAVGHWLRINGLILALALLAFAAFDLPRARGAKHRHWHLALFVGAMVLASAPYDYWRAVQNGSMFEYGTNSRLWADDLWNFDDPYWHGGPKETFGDYWRTHTLGDFVGRLGCGYALETYDFMGGMPGYRIEPCGLSYPRQDAGEIALNPILLVCLFAAALWVRDRGHGLTALLLGITFATLAWMYPLTRSVRYFSPFIPLLIVTAIAGLAAASRYTRHPRGTAAAVVGAFLVLFAIRPVLNLSHWGPVLTAQPALVVPALQMLLALAALAWGCAVLGDPVEDAPEEAPEADPATGDETPSEDLERPVEMTAP